MWKFIFLFIPTGAQQAFLCGSQCSFINHTHISPVKAQACIILQLCWCKDTELCLLLVFIPQLLKQQENGSAETWEGKAGRTSDDAGMDPEGSWGAAGRQSKILVQFSCGKQKLQQPKWCRDERDGKTLRGLLKIITRVGAGGFITLLSMTE